MEQEEIYLMKFQQRFGNEQSCIDELARHRWPGGYRCSHCEHGKAYQLSSRPRVFQCVECGHQESVTAGTIFHRTRTSLVKWFWMAYFIGHDKRGVSALFLSRELKLRYATAWLMAHKIRHALSESCDYPLQGMIEIDETYSGGRGKPESKGRSLANKNKQLIVIAVERVPVKEKQKKGIKKSGYVAGSVRALVIPAADSENLGNFVKSNVAKGSQLFSDGWKGYSGFDGWCEHYPKTQIKGENANIILPIVHTQIGNFKSWIDGTFHGISSKHLPRYLREWSYRTNRRHKISNILDFVLRRAMNRQTITLTELSNGQFNNGALPALTG